MKNLLQEYGVYFSLVVNVLFPLAGIYLLDWSIAEIFLLFFTELLFLGGITILEILFAGGWGGFGSKIRTLLGFLLFFPMLYIVIFILAGNFFNGNEPDKISHVSIETLKILLATSVINFVFSFLLNGKFLRTSPEEQAGECFFHAIALCFFLFVILLPLSFMIPADAQSYLLGTSLVIVKNAVDFFGVRRMTDRSKARLRR